MNDIPLTNAIVISGYGDFVRMQLAGVMGYDHGAICKRVQYMTQVFLRICES